MEKILYVTDLDGTLLTRQDRISSFSIQTINELVEKGMLFTYATARSLVSASKATEGLSTNIPVIAYNGAFIFQPSTGEILSKEEFTKEERNRIKDILNQYCISPLVYSFIDGVEKVSWIPQNENDGIRRYLSMRQGDKRFRVAADREALYQGDMFYFTCIGEKEELQPIYDIFSNDSRYRCTMQQELYRPEYWCEIMPALATKANAIRKLKEMWGCTKMISFGDAINDIPMFEISDECYAVSNAVDELKAVATGIIESNEEDGVAKWLFHRRNTMKVRNCNSGDLSILAKFNKRLIEDEQSDNAMSETELYYRMEGFLKTEYDAYLFEVDDNAVGYALVKNSCKPLYLRQFYIDRPYRRMHYGEQAFHELLDYLNVETIDIEVLTWNEQGMNFWKKLNFKERSVYMRYN